jgi:glycosyltransferase involved in cell wall biosynthesis
MSLKIFIIIPVYNEGNTLIKTINNIRKNKIKLPIVIVDDGSTIPVKIGNRKLIYLLRHQINLGKGSALKTGINYAFNKGAQAVILMDGDGQHCPIHLPQFIKLLNQGNDLVFGCRQFGSDVPLIRLLGNRFASIYINLLFGVYVSDLLSGYRGLNRKAYRLVKWKSTRYGIETEMVARLGKYRNHLKYKEIPIDSIYFDKYKGVTIIDAVNILANSITWKLSSVFK